jgi:hypothetical protein
MRSEQGLAVADGSSVPSFAEVGGEAFAAALSMTLNVLRDRVDNAACGQQQVTPVLADVVSAGLPWGPGRGEDDTDIRHISKHERRCPKALGGSLHGRTWHHSGMTYADELVLSTVSTVFIYIVNLPAAAMTALDLLNVPFICIHYGVWYTLSHLHFLLLVSTMQ